MSLRYIRLEFEYNLENNAIRLMSNVITDIVTALGCRVLFIRDTPDKSMLNEDPYVRRQDENPNKW